MDAMAGGIKVAFAGFTKFRSTTTLQVVVVAASSSPTPVVATPSTPSPTPVEVAMLPALTTPCPTALALHLAVSDATVSAPHLADTTVGQLTGFDGMCGSESAGFLGAEVPPLWRVRTFVTAGERLFASMPRYHPTSGGGTKLAMSTNVPVATTPPAGTTHVVSTYCISVSSQGLRVFPVSLGGTKQALAAKNALAAWVGGHKPAISCRGTMVCSLAGVPTLVANTRVAATLLKEAASSLYRASASEGAKFHTSGEKPVSGHFGQYTYHATLGVAHSAQAAIAETASCLKSAIGAVKRLSHCGALNSRARLVSGISVPAGDMFACGCFIPPNMRFGTFGLITSAAAKFPEVDEKLIVTAKLALTPSLRARLFNLLEPSDAEQLVHFSDGAASLHWHHGLVEIKGDDAERMVKAILALLRDLDVDVEDEAGWWM